MTIEIRAADKTELPETARLLFDEFPQTLPCRATADLGRILEGLHKAMPYVVVAVQDGRVVGALVLREETWWWSRQRFVTDRVFFVSPRARASRIATDMVRLAKGIAASVQAPLVMGVMNGEDADRKDRWFTRNGFRRLGGFYVLEG